MSWWLARIYLCAAILNNVIAITTRSYLTKNNYSNTGERNNPRIGRNAKDNVETQKSVDDDNKIILGEKVNDIDESYTAETRSLAAGDSFTPNEMFPIAEKLLNKVDDPGNGKGFVSSSASPQMLADKLFEAYFSTTKRIIFLNDEDLPGLDALQALALSGETVDSQAVANIEIEENDMYLRCKARKMQPKRGKYKLVSKNVTRQEPYRKPKRRRIELAKHLNKKRHLIVNKRHNKRAKDISESHTSQTKKSSYFRKGNAGETINPKCRWNYKCSNIVDLDTCRIHSLCGEAFNKSINYDIPKINEYGLEAFRKMMKIHYVDEEVEKILESRNLQLRPSNQAVKERVESLAEYFNKVVVEEKLGITKALKT